MFTGCSHCGDAMLEPMQSEMCWPWDFRMRHAGDMRCVCRLARHQLCCNCRVSWSTPKRTYYCRDRPHCGESSGSRLAWGVPIEELLDAELRFDVYGLVDHGCSVTPDYVLPFTARSTPHCHLFKWKARAPDLHALALNAACVTQAVKSIKKETNAGSATRATVYYPAS
jgi:hypothetical protein